MRLLWKLYLGFVALVVLTTVIVGVLVGHRVEAESLAQVESDLRGESLLLREVARDSLGDRERLRRRIDLLGEDLPTRLTVVGADGAVLADTHADPAETDDHANRPEILEAARTGSPATATRYSHTVGVRMMYTALPVREGGRTLAYVRASIPLDAVDARLAQLRRYVVLGAAGALLMALVPGFLFARRVTGSLASMTAAARAFAEGDYDYQLPARAARDELGTLTRAFTTMAAQLRERLQTIETDRNKLRAILGSMVEGVVAIDAAERVVHLNDVAATILDVEVEASLGLRIWEATRFREVCRSLTEALHADRATRVEVRLPTRGHDVILELHASPLRDAAGATTGAVVVLHDVTALRRVETLRREFVANVSHELKTPLTAIGGLVETMLDDPDMPAPTQLRFLEKIQKQSERLTILVRDLLTLSRVESEEEFLEREAIDLREPILNSVHSLRPEGLAKDLDVATELPEAPVPILGDAEALRQVVDNLLSNAIKYTPARGKVWVRVRREDDRAVIEVEDTGIGLEPREKARIFERFYRVDKARSRELGGTGLGLSIVKHVVLAHRGAVSVESEPGRGTTFRVDLPIEVPGAGGGEGAAETVPLQGSEPAGLTPS